MPLDENDILQRLVKVETILDSIVSELSELRENHLFHLKADIEKLSEKISGNPSWAVALVIAGLAGFVGVLVPIVLSK